MYDDYLLEDLFVSSNNDYEESYMEDYLDALNESSSTAKYLAHHSIAGGILGDGSLSFLNSSSKAKYGAGKLYPKYLKYCRKHGIKPVNRQVFTKESAKFYKHKRDFDASSMFLGSTLYTMYKTHKDDSREFAKKAGMIDDIKD